jgi:hypothetical protein
MNVDLEPWAKRAGALVVLLGFLLGIWRFGVKVYGRVRYHWAVYVSLRQMHELLSPNGGAAMILQALLEIKSDMKTAVDRVDGALREVRWRQHLNDQRWRVAHDDDPRAMFEADASGAWIWVNSTLLAFADGRQPGEMLGNGWVTSLTERWQDGVEHKWNVDVKAQRNFECQAELAIGDGRALVRITACVLRDENGRAMGWSGQVTRLMRATDQVPSAPLLPLPPVPKSNA